TPFLNIHWFCDKTGHSGSRLQIINGFCLMVVFFCARIVFGLYSSYQFALAMIEKWDQIPHHLIYIYSVANVLLNGLNLFWFYKIISMGLRRLMGPKESVKKVKKTE
ncbi:hypothetical protein HK102_007025, partial [Quaeritorhiza haematococci]